MSTSFKKFQFHAWFQKKINSLRTQDFGQHTRKSLLSLHGQYNGKISNNLIFIKFLFFLLFFFSLSFPFFIFFLLKGGGSVKLGWPDILLLAKVWRNQITWLSFITNTSDSNAWMLLEHSNLSKRRGPVSRGSHLDESEEWFLY